MCHQHIYRVHFQLKPRASQNHLQRTTLVRWLRAVLYWLIYFSMLTCHLYIFVWRLTGKDNIDYSVLHPSTYSSQYQKTLHKTASQEALCESDSKTVVTRKIKHLQKCHKNVLVFYFTYNYL